jgi:hypothetical protein
MPSLEVLLDQVASERATISSHGESLDTKAGVVLGFAGVLVGLGATVQAAVSNTVVFRVGLGVAVVAALFAVWAFIPRRYPVLEVVPMRESLTWDEAHTRLALLDTQIAMVEQAAALVKKKGWRIQAAVMCLAAAAALVVAGTLEAGGAHG